jgi:hypothetical protein
MSFERIEQFIEHQKEYQLLAIIYSWYKWSDYTVLKHIFTYL